MTEQRESVDRLLDSLKERAKELNCLYEIEELLRSQEQSLHSICPSVAKAIPPGWQYPDVTEATITLDGQVYKSSDFEETEWVLRSDIRFGDLVVGSVAVYYTKEMPASDEGPFLKEEARLIKTIAERLGHRYSHSRMRDLVDRLETVRQDSDDRGRGEWRVVVEMLRQTDRELYLAIARKMLNHLSWTGVSDAERLLQRMGTDHRAVEQEELLEEWNIPHQRRGMTSSTDSFAETFQIAANHISDNEILSLIHRWVQEDKLSFLVQVVNRNLSLAEVADAIRRYHHLAPESAEEPRDFSPSKRGVQVSLIRRFLSDQLQYINVAKNFVHVRDFYDLLSNVIFSAESHGKLGGKSAGLYVATQILRRSAEQSELLGTIKVPKTWYITSDVLLHYMHHNNFDEVVEQKYKEINQVRLEYPHIVQTFKNARFPADIVKGLSVALDDFGDRPLIVRSSSLLEDRMGAAFSGKYKSLFIANQGNKEQRLDALMDAIAEVYASTFGPDPIEYRAERGLIDFGEEMGIMIQEVVGKRVGKYFLPAFAGVAFSRNEFRWSPRIGREDGLVRMVPGLGTRAVDRLSDDYPVLVAPGQPGLRVNTTPDEMVRYSPRKIDVINMETNRFESLEIGAFLKEVEDDMPSVRDLVSVYSDGHLRTPGGMGVDYENDDMVITFEGLFSRTPFVKQMQAMLHTLERTLGWPVDIEFACDGTGFYLLQCRPQSYSEESMPCPIPKDISEDRLVFTANQFVSNGRIPDITHIVYVNPREYGALSNKSDMVAVGRAVGKLNKLLPKRQFVLMGPGRWGSRGDIKLGVSVTYSDINNTAALIEIALKTGNYVPDLSFGTHFFQDLVEANIRYLPLYPDDEGIVFNRRFLENTPSILSDVLPEYAHLDGTVRLIDVGSGTDGLVLRVLMNAELGEAVGLLTDPSEDEEKPELSDQRPRSVLSTFWRWRYRMVEHIASELDGDRFGVAGFYVFGSTKNASAGPGSDIDIIIHFRGTPTQLEQLNSWLEGWSLCLDEMNYLRTGYRCGGGLLDVHIVSDDDIARKTSFAAKIGAVTDAARELQLKRPGNGS